MDKINTCPFLVTQLVKESACSAGDLGLISGSVREIPWRRERQPTVVFLPGEFMDRGAWWGYCP